MTLSSFKPDICEKSSLDDQQCVWERRCMCVAAVMKLLVKVAPTPWDWLKLCVIA